MNRATLAFFIAAPLAAFGALGGACDAPLEPSDPTTAGAGGADGGDGGSLGGGGSSSASGGGGAGGSLPEHCTNLKKDADERGVDCGGSCPGCGVDGACSIPGDCASRNCQGGACACPTGMIPVPTSTGTKFCIDSTEVTMGAYDTFFQGNPTTLDQPAECLWNTNWTPKGGIWPADLNALDVPVRFVNWCQARAYCAYDGKNHENAVRHLCGAITGGSAPTANAADPGVDQWYSACSAQGANDPYPYGATYSPTKCNGVNQGLGSLWAVTTATCPGGTSASLYDMSGNVAEWEDACSGTTGDTDTCLARGGSFASDSNALECASAPALPRNYAGADVGFRCCL